MLMTNNSRIYDIFREYLSMSQVSKKTAAQIAFRHLKTEQKGKGRIALVEKEGSDWIVRGTCPIDMEGHQWAEKFEITIDAKGKIKSANYSLL